MPEKPVLTVSLTDAGNVLLQWYPPPNPLTPLLGYRLTFGRTDVIPFTVVEFPMKENRYTANDIHKGAIYIFRLSACNKMGFGKEAVKEVTTPEDAPSGFPENIYPEETSATSLLLSWKSVPLMEQNGKITKYSVLYKDVNSRGNSSEVVVPHPQTSVLLEGLSADTVYDVRVRAFSVVGPGPYSPSIQFRTQRLDQGRTHYHSNKPSSLTRVKEPPSEKYGSTFVTHTHSNTHQLMTSFKCPLSLSCHCRPNPNIIFPNQGRRRRSGSVC